MEMSHRWRFSFQLPPILAWKKLLKFWLISSSSFEYNDKKKWLFFFMWAVFAFCLDCIDSRFLYFEFICCVQIRTIQTLFRSRISLQSRNINSLLVYIVYTLLCIRVRCVVYSTFIKCLYLSAVYKSQCKMSKPFKMHVNVVNMYDIKCSWINRFKIKSAR